MTDGNLSTDLGALAEHGVDCTAAVFTTAAWEDGGDPIAEAFAPTAFGILAAAWDLAHADVESSASRQHYIDTGRYLPQGGDR